MRKENGDILARRIPNASHEVLPGVAHGIPIVDEAAIGRALAQVRRGGPASATAQSKGRRSRDFFSSPKREA